MTGLQLALALGLVIGAGVAGAVYALIPPRPDLAAVLERLSPPARRRLDVAASASPDAEERLGIWAERTFPARLLGAVPTRDLAVLRRSRAQFYGRKVAYGLLGLVLPGAMTAFVAMLGIHVPTVVPVGGTVVLGALMFMAPSRDVAHDAAQARAECSRALSAYIELCAMERNSGASATAALAAAAEVGDSWLFERIRAELARARFDGQPPWDALTHLADILGLPELADIADIMRLAGDENTEVYRSLRARSASVRSALLAAELSQANVVEERMYVPGSFLGVVFLALLMAPSLLRLFEM